MKLERFFFLAATAVMALFFVGAPETALATATERVVYQTSGDCTASTYVQCYTTIASAIDAADAASADYITIKPGTYTTTPLTLSKNVSISGTETSRCIISGGGSGPIITISGVASISIRRITFANATTGLSVMNSTSVNITNNVFRVGTSGTAVSVEGTSTVNIINNTFYQNFTGVSFVTGTTLDIENNIFYGNGTGSSTAISSSAAATVQRYNCFYNITAGQTDTVGSVTTNPTFVDPTAGDAGDFHLQEGSGCIDTGTTSCASCGLDGVDSTTADIGAYGGPTADTIPFQVAVSTPIVSGTGPYSVAFDWSQNLCYLVTNTDASKRGGYKVYYSLNQSGPPYLGTTASTGVTQGDSPINAGYVTTYTLSGLSAATAPAAPTILSVVFANQTLKLSWSSVSGATGYKVYYTDTDVLPLTELNVDVGNTTSYDLTGLINYHDYEVTVSAYTQNTYYIAVTAYDSTTGTKTPGVQHESAYSTEKAIDIGSQAVGPKSTSVTEFPEPIIPNPNLPNKGCFIATAAYGYYSAPQVQALREFRDRYLTTSVAGRAFVQWYYQHGPAGAQFINEHPWLKPVVRTALLPAVGGAMFMTRTSMFTKTIVFMFVGLLTIIRLSTLQKKGDAS